jgi:hypothetical protein
MTDYFHRAFAPLFLVDVDNCLKMSRVLSLKPLPKDQVKKLSSALKKGGVLQEK